MLLTIKGAATTIGVPAASLRRAAEEHGLLVRMGRTVRIEEKAIPELIEKCRNAPKGRASTGTKRAANGSSEILADLKLQQAQMTAERLKSSSRATSRSATALQAQAGPMN